MPAAHSRQVTGQGVESPRVGQHQCCGPVRVPAVAGFCDQVEVGCCAGPETPGLPVAGRCAGCVEAPPQPRASLVAALGPPEGAQAPLIGLPALSGLSWPRSEAWPRAAECREGDSLVAEHRADALRAVVDARRGAGDTAADRAVEEADNDPSSTHHSASRNRPRRRRRMPFPRQS